MRVTLTFDNGPHPDVTPQVLRVLREHGVQAYFFLVGDHVREYGADLPLQAAAEGHLIGNHTFHHQAPLGLQEGEAGVREVVLTQELISPAAGETRLFRPAGGRGVIGPHLLSGDVWAHLKRNGYSCVIWNCLVHEWEDPHAWVEPALERCRGLDHSVVVLHDLPTGAIDHLDRFIQALKSEGAAFTTDLPDDCVPMRHGQVTWSEARVSEIVTWG